MAKRFRLAIVGAGQITKASHLPAALASSSIELVALIDPAVSRADAMLREYGVEAHTGPDLNLILSEIDGAVIATPNHTHAELAIACLRVGVSTLIEKPLATSLEEGKRIIKAANETGAKVGVGYSTRFRSNISLLAELLRESYFGKTRRFAHQFGTVGGWAPISGYNLDIKTAGGGVLVVTGTHFLDRMLYFWGYPHEIRYADDSHGGPEANCVAHFGFVDHGQAIEGCAVYSKTFALKGALVIETDQGTIFLQDTDTADIVFHPNDAPEGIQHVIRAGSNDPFGDVFLSQLEDFADACRENRQPLADGEQGLQSVKLIEALYARRTPLPEDWYDEEFAT